MTDIPAPEEIPIDSEGRAQCPKCKKWIKCGPGGVRGMMTLHYGKGKCLEAANLRSSNGPALKDSSILAFLRAPRSVPHTATQTKAPQPITTLISTVEDLKKKEPVPGPDVSNDADSEPKNHQVTFYKTQLANKFQTLVDSLPDNQNLQTQYDYLSPFASDPALYDNKDISNEDIWEELVNPFLKATLGWGISLDVEEVIGGRRDGLMGVAPYVDYFVQKRRVSEALFEGKLTHLMDGMRAVVKEREPVGHTVQTNKSVPIKPSLNSAATEVLQNKKDKLVKICPGFKLDFPSGSSPHSSYPFALHDSQTLPWNYSVSNSVMYLQSYACAKTVKEGKEGTVCDACRGLAELPILKGISKRINDKEIPENLPYAYRSMAQLQTTLKHKDNLINFFRLRGLNQAKSLLVHSHSLSEYKRFMVAIANGTYRNVERVIRIGLQQKHSITAIIQSFYAASKGMYQPKSYTEEEDMKGLLLFKLGGSRVAGIAHRALGLPAVSTLRTRATMPPLIPSPSLPMISEVSKNIEACFDSIQDILEGKNVVHQVAMFDEIATEKRLRWDEDTNHFLGVCREHGKETSLEFNSLDDLEELFGCLERKEVHIAAEATVCALGLLSEETRIYAGRPVLISGDCKRESGEEHAKVIQVVLDASKSIKLRTQTKLRVVSLASDGETRRGSALALLTFKHKLLSTSPIYPALSTLKFMDLHVGDDDITADKDWKHVIKRFRNLLLRSRGVLVQGIRITPSIIESHLKMSGHTAAHLHSLFNPDDEQDVKLAFDLLKAIWSLPLLNDHRNPSVLEARNSLRILGKFLYHMVFPYLCVELSLSEQLEHFSAAAHLGFILYRSAGKAFIPTLLYADLMVMIKNIYFCVAKAKVDDPYGKFFVMLLGTDRLEELFGILRTMVGNDANLDIWQLSSRLTGTTQISNILAKYPHWDCAPRRLKLPAITRDSKELPGTSDHIKPASWKGNVYVKEVTLQTAWKRGRRLVQDECSFSQPILSSLELNSEITILAPFSKLLVGTTVDPDEEDESQEIIPGATVPIAHTVLNDISNPLESQAPNDSSEEDSNLTAVPSPINTETLTQSQNEVEDALIASDHPAEVDTSSKHQRHIIYNGKSMLKARALALRSRLAGKAAPSSTDRLKRVQEVERYGKGSSNEPTTANRDTASSSNEIVIQDPVSALVQCDGNIFLCLGEVNNIKVDSNSVASISLQDIIEADLAKITISFSMFGLRRTTVDDDPSHSADWRSYRALTERTIHIPGKFVTPIDPPVVAQSLSSVFYLLEGGFLVSLAASLFGSLEKADVKKLPQVPVGKDFPYYEETGKACFAISSPQLDEITGTMDVCPLCGFDLSKKGSPQTLAHMAAHILHDPKINREDLPCGLCLRPAPLCVFILGKGTGRKTKINWSVLTGCPNRINFKYSIAKESTATSPCSNVPIECPLCPAKSPAQWRYNLQEHFRQKHSKEALIRHQHLWTLTSHELDEMKKVWKDRHSQSGRRLNESSKQKVVISEAHTSRATLRDAAEGLSDAESNANLENEGSDNEDSVGLDGDAVDQRVAENTVEASPLPTVRPQSVDREPDFDLPMYVLPTTPGTAMGAVISSSVETQQTLLDTTETETSIPTPTPMSSSMSNPVAPLRIPDENHHPVESLTSQRPQRKRSRINVQELSKCVCGDSAHPMTQLDGQVTPEVIRCKQRSCETQWYHLTCVNLDYVPRSWTCEACLVDRNGKRMRNL